MRWLSLDIKYRDNETGCYYYGYRYLRTKHGRWLSRDPIGEADNAALYVYINNGAPNYVDFLGLVALPPQGNSTTHAGFSSTTQSGKSAEDKSRACCRFKGDERRRRMSLNGSGVISERHELARKQATFSCPSNASSPAKCCPCDLRETRSEPVRNSKNGTISDNTVDEVLGQYKFEFATWGSCCRCKVKQHVHPGGWPLHSLIKVTCSDGSMWYADHPSPRAIDIKSEQVNKWFDTEYPLVVASYDISCEDAADLRKKANSYQGASYGGWQDCWWYVRQLLGDRGGWYQGY